MAERLKVLMSAYACEPGKGSEPEVGWQWALQMSRFHDVTVVTRANNRPSIETGLASWRGKQPLPEFIYHDCNGLLLDFKRSTQSVRTYYVLWQRSARELLAQLHAERQFDLMHHVTFAAYRYPTAIWGHGVPTVWGPIGGIESIPPRLLPWSHPRSLLHELSRSVSNLLQATPFVILPKRAAASTVLLASTPEMRKSLERLRFHPRLMPTIGLHTDEFPAVPRSTRNKSLRILFVGNLITLKGVDLALDALAASRTDATFALIGTGDYEPAARKRVARLGLNTRVSFLGRLPREEVLRRFHEFDLFLFPSLHDTGGYAVIEAMVNELPVVCLDCGGPSVAVDSDSGIKVPLAARREVVAGLAAAIEFYDQNRTALAAHGRNARQAVLRRYDWDRKGEQMDQIYQEAVNTKSNQQPGTPPSNYTGITGMVSLLHRMFSLRGLMVAALGLILVGALGFLSLSLLKSETREIVDDTLPGLAYAGSANANLARAFSRTLLLISEDDPATRRELREEIMRDSKRTTEYLEQYRQHIYATEDLARFEILLQRRDEYLQVREQTIELVAEDRQKEAIQMRDNSLLPAYDRYKDAGELVLKYNLERGQFRGGRIMKVFSLTQLAVAVIGVGIFLAGFFLGLFR